MSARITIDGNLTADPDFGVSNAGTNWARLLVAGHGRVKRNREWTSTDPEFFTITLFGKSAEDAGDTRHKGDRVTIEGRPEPESFDRRDRSTGATINVHAQSVPLLVLDEDTTGRTSGRGNGPTDRESAQESVPTIRYTAGAAPAPAPERAATNGRSR